MQSPAIHPAVTMIWKEHQANPDDQPGPDFLAMNKLATIRYKPSLHAILRHCGAIHSAIIGVGSMMSVDMAAVQLPLHWDYGLHIIQLSGNDGRHKLVD